MSDIDITTSLSTLHPDWKLSENHNLISRHFELSTFAEALALVNKIGEIAEKQGHHPDINFGWGYVEIYLTTHDIGQVSEKDIALASEPVLHEIVGIIAAEKESVWDKDHLISDKYLSIIYGLLCFIEKPLLPD